MQCLREFDRGNGCGTVRDQRRNRFYPVETSIGRAITKRLRVNRDGINTLRRYGDLKTDLKFLASPTRTGCGQIFQAAQTLETCLCETTLAIPGGSSNLCQP